MKTVINANIWITAVLRQMELKVLFTNTRTLLKSCNNKESD